MVENNFSCRPWPRRGIVVIVVIVGIIDIGKAVSLSLDSASMMILVHLHDESLRLQRINDNLDNPIGQISGMRLLFRFPATDVTRGSYEIQTTDSRPA